MSTHTASLFALAAPLCFSGLLLAQHTIESETNPLAGNRAAITAGNRLYDGACQSCHGAGARGDRAPALATGVFRHGNADGQLFLNIRNGINGTAMPAFSQFTSDQLWQLVSYIRSLAGTAVVNERVSGNAAAGKTVFEGKGQCLTCHSVGGQGQPVGPDLSAAGNGSAQALEAAILNPNQPPAAAGGGRGPRRSPPTTVTVKTADGHEYRGVRRSEDVFSLQMVDTAGQLHLFDKAGLAELRVENKSLMPDDYARRLTAPEIQNLVAYLKTLTGRDLSQPLAVNIPGGLTSERIANAQAEPQNGLSDWGDLQGRHYSSLSQIDTGNVRQLQARWAVPMPGNGIVESVPWWWTA
jgi:putative heme-binding domain-containing protein